MKMHGNTILVAGGASGIGRGLAELLCRLGNEVIVFGAPPTATAAAVRATAGLRTIPLDLADPWAVAGFAEQLGAAHPGLNMLVNISIAFPLRYLPGMQGLLDGDDTPQRLEAHRLGLQHLTGTLLAHFRRRGRGVVLNVSAGPSLAPPAAPSVRAAMEGGTNGCTLSVRKRWAAASIEVIDVGPPSRTAQQAAGATRPHDLRRGMPLVPFVSSVAHLLAEGLHEEAALARMKALWPARASSTREPQEELAPAVH